MPSIQIDEQTAQALAALAATLGMTIEEYLKLEAAQRGPSQPVRFSEQEFEAELEALTIDGPTLPPDFSRADIYHDHD